MHIPLVNCYSAHEAVWSQTAGPWIGTRLFLRVGYLSCVDWAVWTSWLLTPADIFNFSLANVCQTMMTELSLGCNCTAPPILAWLENYMGGWQRSAEIKKRHEKKEEKKMITFTFSLFPVYMPDYPYNHNIGYVPECNLTYIWHPSLAVSRCCHFHGNKKTLFMRIQWLLLQTLLHTVLLKCNIAGW